MSAIDPTKPTTGEATTESVRNNFLAAKTEIDALNEGKQSVMQVYGNYPPPQTRTLTARAIFCPVPTNAGSVSTAAVTAGRLYAVPFVAPETASLAAIYARVTAGATGNCRLGIYSASSSNLLLPASLLADTGDLSTAAAATIGAAISAELTRGTLYFFAAIFSATPTIQTLAAASCPALFPPSDTALVIPSPNLYVAHAYGPLPESLAGTTWLLTGTSTIMPGLKYA